MKRREFIALAVGATMALPPLARAQQGKIPTIGVLFLSTALLEPFLGDFRAGLRDKGYAEGSTIRLEIRTADGKAELLAERAAELARLNVDAIVAFQTPACMAAKAATTEIPIVMVRVGDPVATGLIDSYARPGGNITGTSAGVAETVGNVVGLMHEIMRPAASAPTFAALLNAKNPFTSTLLAAIDAAARRLGIATVPVLVQPFDPLEPAFEAMAAKQLNAALVAGFVDPEPPALLALKHRLALFATDPAVPRAGGLMSYAATFTALHRETADYVDRILKGTKPADLAVTFPTKFELVVNLRTANAIGLTIPPLLLAQADEVIE